jgi:hypothetical protein
MKALVLHLLFLCTCAHAVDFEASIGTTQFQQTPNGIWWQNGYDHQLDLSSQSFSIGITDRFANGLRWRVAYTRLGNTYSNTMAVSDANYNGVDGCRHPCTEKPWAVKGEGSVRGYSFTVAPEMSIGYGVKVFIEGGAFVFLPKFEAYCGKTMDTAGALCIRYANGWQIGPQLGAGVDYKGTQVVWTAYQVDSPTPDDQAIPNWRGWAMNISLRQRF